MKFLMGLNDSFSQVRTQILLMDPLPSFNKVCSLLIQEEMQMSVSLGTRVESTALATKNQNFTTSNGGSNRKGKDRSLCTNCGKLGHTIDKCYKLHGFPPSYKFKNKSMAHLVSFVTPQLYGDVSSRRCAWSCSYHHSFSFFHTRSVPTITCVDWCTVKST